MTIIKLRVNKKYRYNANTNAEVAKKVVDFFIRGKSYDKEIKAKIIKFDTLRVAHL